MFLNLAVLFQVFLFISYLLCAIHEDSYTELQQELIPPKENETKINYYAEMIHRALIESDLDVVVDVVIATNVSERLAIAWAYYNRYAKSLDIELENKIENTDLGNLMAGMFVSRAVFLAKDLRSAITGLGTDEDTLSEIMCCLNASERKELRETYRVYFDTDLVKDIEEDTSGHYETLLLHLTIVARDDRESDIKSFKLKVADAVTKLTSETQKIPTVSPWPTSKSPLHEVIFVNFQPIVDVFSSNSFFVIWKASIKFKIITGNELKETIRRSTSGDFQDLLLDILQFSEYDLIFHARKIHAGLTEYWYQPNRKPLTRALVMLSKVELARLQDIYWDINGREITEALYENLRDPYNSAVTRILNSNDDWELSFR
ncbi:unnamed protein product [Orchesella dallaii]|uniref:Uncharacterized protein n=1 Tax=Orchesella dallaii TaxID=48710 RepID=A0ABP1R5U7_9HEXA